MREPIGISRFNALAALGIVAHLAFAPCIACGQAGFALPSVKFAPKIKVDKSKWMSEEQIRQASPKPASGALWSTTVARSLRKVHLIGRPSRLVITSTGILTPFENRILDRNFSDGKFGINIPPVAEQTIDQIVWRRRAGAARTFRSLDDPKSATDILYRRWGKEDRWLKGHTIAPWRVLLSPEGERLVSCSDDKTTRLWDTSSGKQLAEFPGYGYGGNLSVRRGEFAAFSPDGRTLATAFNQEVSFRRASDGEVTQLWPLTRHVYGINYVRAVRFALDGTSLFAFTTLPDSEEKSVKFLQWDFYDSEPRPFEGTQSAVDGKMSLDRKYLVTWNGSSRIVVWELYTRQQVKTLEVAPNRMFDLTFAPSRTILATAGDDDVVRFWNIGDWTERKAKRKYRHPGIDFVRFSSEGRHLVTGSSDGLLKVWNAPEFARAKVTNGFYRPWLDN